MLTVVLDYIGIYCVILIKKSVQKSVMSNDEISKVRLFCQEHFQHPVSSVMWCEDNHLKRLIERNNAEESLRIWRRRKAEELARKERDKKEVH